MIPSFVYGSWHTAEDTAPNAVPVVDAFTGEEIARISSAGVDFQKVVDYGRMVGQKSLGELTIHERALKLKELANYLTERKGELYELSYATGATKRDSWIDIDGGIGTMFTYSSKGRRELPNANVILDGPTEVLSKDGSFLGTHIYTRLPGVAVQINAFNFPVWGMLEKFAPAFIAGVPTIVKPATPTGYLAVRCVEIMLDSGILPEGSLQIISGSAGDLLSRLDYRDHVAFTGSASTALKLEQASLSTGVRFSAEADSLNAAILGLDVDEESPEYQAYIRALFGEISAKAGQKCTAIRRAIVPAPLVDKVIASLSEMIEKKVVLGDPRDEKTTMGPLASPEQFEEVSKAVASLIDAGAVAHHPNIAQVEGVFAPVILTASEKMHDVEAFGPVLSVVGYETTSEAIELARRGKGSLVATVCTHDPELASEFAMGIAAHHGRLHYLDREDAKTSTGHGSPLPHLIHGGPGRAGGGEELGGIRGVKHLMQRTAIQGTPTHLTAITGVWHRGAPTNTDGHPFRKDLAHLKLGDQLRSELRKVTLEDILEFAEKTGDTFYAHTDEEAATANPFFPRRVAHGYLLVSWAAGLFVEPAPGPVLANYGLENLRFITPVTYDDSIRVELTAKKITPRVTDEYGEVVWDTVIYNQNDEIVATYDVLTLVEKVEKTYV